VRHQYIEPIRSVRPLRAADEPTDFEREAARLGLDGIDAWRRSAQLRAWVVRWRFSRHVPEDLLEVWSLGDERS
jgi:hypothetical protein